MLHDANRFLNKFHSDGSLAMLTVDFSNAFNLVDRTTLLHEVRIRCPSISLWVDFLYGQSASFAPTCSLDQGLLPTAFPCLVIEDANEVAKAIDIIRAEGPRLGLELNIKKTEVFWPSCNGVNAKNRLFPHDIGRPPLGVKLLGGAVSRDARFISSLAVKRASRAMELMSLLPRLRDPQSELLLLRSCMGVTKLLFGLRTCQPMYIGEVVSIFDNGLRRAIEAIVSVGVSFDLSPRQKAVVECLRAPRAQNFLTVIPIEGLGQHMSTLEYRTILKYRLMILLFLVDEPCPICHKVYLDSFGEHAVHCKELPDPLEGRSTLRPADILVFGWAGGKHACVDLTGVSPLVRLRDNGFVAGQAALKAKLLNTRKLV
ncbi:hypothetical protein Tco_1343710 [Tanacetum coccineum]